MHFYLQEIEDVRPGLGPQAGPHQEPGMPSVEAAHKVLEQSGRNRLIHALWMEI